ncbi:MAG TPA: VOC family protein [Chthoniobacterales bacterium]
MTSNATIFRPVIRRVILRTANAARLAEFYQQLLGLVPREDPAGRQILSLHHPVTNDALLTLIEDKSARPTPPGSPGLYHIAFLFAHLDDWRAVVRRAIPLTGNFHGASDHGVSWAAYLEDADGNGLELAWDKPDHEWPWRGDQIQMVSRSLPLRCILLASTLEQESAGAFGIGHLHLQVADLRHVSAYQEHLTLRVTQSDYPGAIFLARGRYHHHLAINTWNTNPHVARPENATGLVGWDMTADPARGASCWQDPSGSVVTLLPA